MATKAELEKEIEDLKAKLEKPEISTSVPAPQEPQQTVAPVESEAHAKYRALLETYQKQHPVQYQERIVEFERQLAGKISIQVDKAGQEYFVFG